MTSENPVLVSRVLFLQASLLLNEHMANLDQKLTENPDIRILIIDTLQSHIGSTVSTNNNSSVRGVMTPLKRLAEKHHVAVICIEHLTKSKTMAGENATYRVQGSIAFVGVARSVWIVAKDNEDITGFLHDSVVDGDTLAERVGFVDKCGLVGRIVKGLAFGKNFMLRVGKTFAFKHRNHRLGSQRLHEVVTQTAFEKPGLHLTGFFGGQSYGHAGH